MRVQWDCSVLKLVILRTRSLGGGPVATSLCDITCQDGRTAFPRLRRYERRRSGPAGTLSESRRERSGAGLVPGGLHVRTEYAQFREKGVSRPGRYCGVRLSPPWPASWKDFV